MEKYNILIQKYIQLLLDYEEEFPEQGKDIVKYLDITDNPNNEVRDHQWMSDYTSNFNIMGISVRKNIVNDFDWRLLTKLIACSFSNSVQIKVNFFRDADILIYVSSDERQIMKKLLDLNAYQIQTLFMIHIHEQISLNILEIESLEEKKAIAAYKAQRLTSWNDMVKRKVLTQQLFRTLSFRR